MTLYDKFNEQQWNLLLQRARRVEKAVKTEDTRNLQELLIVMLGSEKYAIRVDKIRAVYENVRITNLPGVPPHIAGIANIRGQLVTVLDLAQILKIGTSTTDQYALLMLDFDDMSVAMYVERVSDMAQIALSDLKPVPGDTQDFVQGVFGTGIILIDLVQMMNDPLLVVDQQL